MSCSRQASGSERGMVLLSVLSLMLILSVLVSSAGRQMHWLLQTTTQATNQGIEQADHRLLVGALFALDVGFLTADTDNGMCRWIARCLRSILSTGVGGIYLAIYAMEQQADSSQRELVGWLRKHSETSCGGSALA